MVKIVLYVVSLAILVAIAVWFAETPGSVIVEWHDWRIDTSVAMLFVFVAIILAVGTFLVRAWSTLVGAGRAFRDSRKDKRFNRGLNALAQGFAAVRAGDNTTASKAGRDARSALGELEAVRLLEQQTARISGDDAAANASARTLLTNPALEGAALRELADMAQRTGDNEAALGHALRALDRKPLPAWACQMAVDLQIALGRWPDAAQMIDRKDIQTALNRSDMTALKAALYSRAAHSALANQDAPDATKWARKAISADAKRADAHATLGRALLAEGKSKKAAAELERAWTAAPDPQILSAYLQLAPAETPLARAGRVEKLVSGQPDHPESRIALAEAALGAELWGQARSRLEPLLDKGSAPSVLARAAALMARVDLGDSGDTKAAAQFLITALEARSKSADRPAPTSADELLA